VDRTSIRTLAVSRPAAPSRPLPPPVVPTAPRKPVFTGGLVRVPTWVVLAWEPATNWPRTPWLVVGAANDLSEAKRLMVERAGPHGRAVRYGAAPPPPPVEFSG
jgi:hypothetical protein